MFLRWGGGPLCIPHSFNHLWEILFDGDWITLSSKGLAEGGWAKKEKRKSFQAEGTVYKKALKLQIAWQIKVTEKRDEVEKTEKNQTEVKQGGKEKVVPFPEHILPKCHIFFSRCQ